MPIPPHTIFILVLEPPALALFNNKNISGIRKGQNTNYFYTLMIYYWPLRTHKWLFLLDSFSLISGYEMKLGQIQSNAPVRQK